MIYLDLDCPIDAESIRKVLEELQFLSRFVFQFMNEPIQIDHPKQFEIHACGMMRNVNDPNAAVQFINAQIYDDKEEKIIKKKKKEIMSKKPPTSIIIDQKA